MLSIRKRQSGRLARLILEHSRDQWQYELHAPTPSPKGIDPPCVAVIDLDDVPPDVVQNEYSTQVDLYGPFCILMFFETMIALTVHVFYLFDWGWITWINWVSCIINNLGFCLYAVLCGDGTLTLARRSDTSTPGCAVLLDQHFMVVLNGNQSVIEAIAESGFNLSHPNLVWEFPFGREDHGRDSPYDLIEALCDGACLAAFAACWLLFHPTTTLGGAVPIIVISSIAVILQRTPPNHFSPPQDPWLVAKNPLLPTFTSHVISLDIRSGYHRDFLFHL